MLAVRAPPVIVGFVGVTEWMCTIEGMGVEKAGETTKAARLRRSVCVRWDH